MRFMKSLRAATTVSDALLAVGFQPPAAKSRVSFTILVNKQPVNFTDPIKNGDELEVVISQPEITAPQESFPQAAEASTTPGIMTPPPATAISGRPMTAAAIQDSIRLADKINSIPGLTEALRNNH